MKLLSDRIARTALAAGLVLLAACGGSREYHATPIAAVPTSPEEEAALRAALEGSWLMHHTIYEDGSEDSDSLRVFLMFGADGSFVYKLGRNVQNYTYTIEGRNVRTTMPTMTAFRVEQVTDEELRLFWYDLTVTLVLRKR